MSNAIERKARLALLPLLFLRAGVSQPGGDSSLIVFVSPPLRRRRAAAMAAHTWPALLQRQESDDGNEDIRTAWIAGLYSLHGPPGPSPAPVLPASPAAPFVEPRAAAFHVRISTRDLEALLRGCNPIVPACPWQDVYEWAEETGEVPERKWVIFAEQGEGGLVRVHMHRSWTGVKLIELTIDAASPSRCPLEGGPIPPNDEGPEGMETDRGPRITRIAFEMNEDYRLKGGGERLYKHVAWEVCWWVLGVPLGPETKQ
ncbi:hypothetical protein VUR80DRAFT_8400 [Thermomyces stellatus]